MADFILNRKISVEDKYSFPEGAFKIYGGGRFYNGFSIGSSNNLTVVNEDGVLKFSREATEAQESTSVILGTIPPNTKQRICVDVAVAVAISTYLPIYFEINDYRILSGTWKQVNIYYSVADESNISALQAGGVLALDFTSSDALAAIPNLCSVRAIWAL